MLFSLSFSTALALALLTFFTHLPVVTPLEKLFETTPHFPLIFSALCDCLAGSVLPVERLASTVARPPLRHSDAGEIFWLNSHLHALPSPLTQWCFHFKIVRPQMHAPTLVWPLN